MEWALFDTAFAALYAIARASRPSLGCYWWPANQLSIMFRYFVAIFDAWSSLGWY